MVKNILLIIVVVFLFLCAFLLGHDCVKAFTNAQSVIHELYALICFCGMVFCVVAIIVVLLLDNISQSLAVKIAAPPPLNMVIPIAKIRKDARVSDVRSTPSHRSGLVDALKDFAK